MATVVKTERLTGLEGVRPSGGTKECPCSQTPEWPGAGTSQEHLFAGSIEELGNAAAPSALHFIGLRALETSRSSQQGCGERLASGGQRRGGRAPPRGRVKPADLLRAVF